MKLAFEVWPLAVEPPPVVVVEVHPEYDPPQWHLVCDAAINFAKALPADAPRPWVVCVRQQGAEVTHYVMLLGPPGEGTYAKYLGTTRPSSVEWVEDL